MSILKEEMSNGASGTHGKANGLNGDSNGAGHTNGSGSNHLLQRVKMDRKASSPMLPAFMVSAPGKVIMFGEHAVVHGKVRPVLPLT